MDKQVVIEKSKLAEIIETLKDIETRLERLSQ